MKYCSQECRYLASRTDEATTALMKRRTWHYKRWRKAVFARDDYTCQECRATEHLHAHHIQSWEAYPELAYEVGNGMTLCAACHAIIHGAHIPLRGTKRTTCAICVKVTKGRSKAGLCRSCGMRSSPKFWASQANRGRDAAGHFNSLPVAE